MCRFAAYLGSPRPLATLLYDGEHSLERQAYAPAEMVHGHVNVDGTGIAWWDENAPEPLVYVTERPPWCDINLGRLSRRLAARAQLAAVRSATPGIGFGSAHVQPFVSGELAGVHNGRIGGFRGPLARKLLDLLPDDAFAELEVLNDSQLIFSLVAAHFRQGSPLAASLATALRQITELMRADRQQATLNVAVGDGHRFVACRYSIDQPLNSLYWLDDADHTVLASEPHDQRSGWKPVPGDHIIEITDSSTTIVPWEELL